MDAIIEQFGTSQEFLFEYGRLTNDELISTVYDQMFCRDPDAEGREFYLDKLASGDMTLPTITLDILNGAQNQDRVIIEDKIFVANYFTSEVERLGVNYWMDDIDAARSVLKNVCGEPGDVETALELAVDVLGNM